MANRQYQTAYCLGERIIELAGSFVPLTGAGTVVASSVKGEGFGYAPVNGVMKLQPNLASKSFLTTTPGIVRTGTGLYTITFEDTYLDVNMFTADLAAPVAGSALWAQPVEPIANIGSSTAAIVASMLIVNAAGAPTDAVANMRVYFAIQFRDSTTRFNKP